MDSTTSVPPFVLSLSFSFCPPFGLLFSTSFPCSSHPGPTCETDFLIFLSSPEVLHSCDSLVSLKKKKFPKLSTSNVCDIQHSVGPFNPSHPGLREPWLLALPFSLPSAFLLHSPYLHGHTAHKRSCFPSLLPEFIPEPPSSCLLSSLLQLLSFFCLIKS